MHRNPAAQNVRPALPTHRNPPNQLKSSVDRQSILPAAADARTPVGHTQRKGSSILKNHQPSANSRIIRVEVPAKPLPGKRTAKVATPLQGPYCEISGLDEEHPHDVTNSYVCCSSDTHETEAPVDREWSKMLLPRTIATVTPADYVSHRKGVVPPMLNTKFDETAIVVSCSALRKFRICAILW